MEDSLRRDKFVNHSRRLDIRESEIDHRLTEASLYTRNFHF